MPTSMLDALADEAKAITELGVASSRLAIEAVRRANLLHYQIAHLATAERTQPIAEIPDVAQVEQGSAVRDAPGATPDASTEDGAPPDDPEAAPPPRTRKDTVLDLYAASAQSLRSIARDAGVSYSSLESYLQSARRASDRRVAQGDVLREKEIVEQAAPPAPKVEKPARLVPAGLQEPERKPCLTMPVDDDPKEGNLLALNLDRCTAAFRGQGIQLVRHELRMLLLLNDQQPKPIGAMLERCGVLTRRRLHAEITKLNARIALIDVEIRGLDDDTFVLRRLQAA